MIYIGNIKFIGHRGNQSISSENSFESIINCSINPNIDGVEFDIRITKDNHFVIMHNPYVYSNNNIKIIIQDSNLKDVINGYFKLSLKAVIEHNLVGLISKDKYYLNRYRELHKLTGAVATFESVLDNYLNNKEMLIEIKIDHGEYDCEKENIILNELLKFLNLYKNKNIVIQSFNLEFLKKLKEANKEIPIIGLFTRRTKSKYLIDYPFLDGYSLEYSLATNKIIDEIINQGKKLYTWDNKLTSNHLKMAKRIYKNYKKEIENDILDYSVIVDFPERIKKQIL